MVDRKNRKTESKAKALSLSQIEHLDRELADTGVVPSGYRFSPHGNPRWEAVADAGADVSEGEPKNTPENQSGGNA